MPCSSAVGQFLRLLETYLLPESSPALLCSGEQTGVARTGVIPARDPFPRRHARTMPLRRSLISKTCPNPMVLEGSHWRSVAWPFLQSALATIGRGTALSQTLNSEHQQDETWIEMIALV